MKIYVNGKEYSEVTVYEGTITTEDNQVVREWLKGKLINRCTHFREALGDSELERSWGSCLRCWWTWNGGGDA